MRELTRIEQGLLELGLEDWIPLPQIEEMPEVRRVVEEGRAFEQVSTALVELLSLGRIQVWSGYWQDEPTRVDPGRATKLLRDRRRYSYDEEAAHDLERVYYVNVENVRNHPAEP